MSLIHPALVSHASQLHNDVQKDNSLNLRPSMSSPPNWPSDLPRTVEYMMYWYLLHGFNWILWNFNMKLAATKISRFSAFYTTVYSPVEFLANALQTCIHVKGYYFEHLL